METKKEQDLTDFLKKVAILTEQNNTKLASVKKPMRVYFQDDWSNKLSVMNSQNNLNYSNVTIEAIDYTIDMWNEWIKTTGTISDFDKASVVYELSKAISIFLTKIDSDEFYKTVFVESIRKF